MKTYSNDPDQTKRSLAGHFSLYVVIACVSVLLVLNPIVFRVVAAAQDSTAHNAYLLALDLCLVVIAGAAIVYRLTDRRTFFWLTVLAIGMTPALMAVAELGISYGALRYGREWRGDETIDVYEADSQLGWRLIPHSRGRQVRKGNFDATYVIDGEGRRALPEPSVEGPTVEVFGSSFTFGDGVDNAETALHILADRNANSFRVENYSVSAYGLDQMVLNLERHRDSIEPGDVVVLAPTPLSISWNMIEKSLPCQYSIAPHEYLVGEFPFLEEDGWHFVDLKKSCGLLETLLLNSPGLPIGTIYRARRIASTRAATIDHADKLFAHARRIVEAKRARFVVMMILNSDECLTKRLNFDLSGLKTPYHSMMADCPSDEATLRSFNFPTDWHYSVEGNRWLAGVIQKMLFTAEPDLQQERGLTDANAVLKP